jgi:hypothetical protein
LHAIGVGVAVVGGLHELHIRLVHRIHTSQCNAYRGGSKVGREFKLKRRFRV